MSCQRSKRFTLFVLYEDMNETIKIIKSLGDLSVLIGRDTETLKHQIKKQEGGFHPALLARLATSLVQPVISSVLKAASGRGNRRDEKGHI